MCIEQGVAVNVGANGGYTSVFRDTDLKVGESVTLTDTTGSFSNYQDSVITNTGNLEIKKSGNKVTLKALISSSISGRVSFRYNIDKNYEGTPVVYTNLYTQNVMIGYVNDPNFVHINIKVLKNGNARVCKVDETTKQPLAGAVFRFTTSAGQTKEITTGADGYATWNDLLVDTKVTIQEIKAPNGYVLNSTPLTLTIKVNETTTITKDNKEQLANIKVIKEDEETGSTP